jgi:hypothetical protein
MSEMGIFRQLEVSCFRIAVLTEVGWTRRLHLGAKKLDLPIDHLPEYNPRHGQASTQR